MAISLKATQLARIEVKRVAWKLIKEKGFTDYLEVAEVLRKEGFVFDIDVAYYALAYVAKKEDWQSFRTLLNGKHSWNKNQKYVHYTYWIPVVGSKVVIRTEDAFVECKVTKEYQKEWQLQASGNSKLAGYATIAKLEHIGLNKEDLIQKEVARYEAKLKLFKLIEFN